MCVCVCVCHSSVVWWSYLDLRFKNQTSTCFSVILSLSAKASLVLWKVFHSFYRSLELITWSIRFPLNSIAIWVPVSEQHARNISWFRKIDFFSVLTRQEQQIYAYSFRVYKHFQKPEWNYTICVPLLSPRSTQRNYETSSRSTTDDESSFKRGLARRLWIGNQTS